MRRFSLRSLRCGAFAAEPSLRSLHCGAFTAEPSLRTLTADSSVEIVLLGFHTKMTNAHAQLTSVCMRRLAHCHTSIAGLYFSGGITANISEMASGTTEPHPHITPQSIHHTPDHTNYKSLFMIQLDRYTVKKRVLPQHLLGCSYACLNTTPLGCYTGCCECTHRVL